MNGKGPSVVAVTGASGYIGTRLLHELETEEDLAKVVAIDTKPLPVPFHHVSLERMDITHPLDDLLKENRVDTVVHLAFILKPGRGRRESEAVRLTNLKGLQRVLSACVSAKVRNLIYLSSHTIYGAHPDNALPMTEVAELRPSQGFQYSRDKSMGEGLVQLFAVENPGTNVTVLRSCVVMGPGADNYVTRAIFKPVLLGIMGSDPPLQFVHEDDLANLLRVLIKEPHPGTYNVAADGVVHYTELARLANRKLVFLPPFMAYPLTQMAWNLGLQKDSPGVGLDFVRYPIIMSTGKLKRDTGVRFSYTSEEALMAYLPDQSL